MLIEKKIRIEQSVGAKKTAPKTTATTKQNLSDDNVSSFQLEMLK